MLLEGLLRKHWTRHATRHHSVSNDTYGLKLHHPSPRSNMEQYSLSRILAKSTSYLFTGPDALTQIPRTTEQDVFTFVSGCQTK